MLLRDLTKMNSINDGSRTLFESIAIPEVEQALKDWKKQVGDKGVLIGGTAAGFYTKPRSTTDIDILFLSLSDIPTQVPGFKRTRPGAFQHNKTHVEVEVVTPSSINLTVELVQQVFDTSVLSDGIRVASPSGLVALKLFRMSRYDEGDVWSLIETGKVNLDDWVLPQAQLDIYKKILLKMKQ
jgi:hypothetical protein